MRKAQERTLAPFCLVLAALEAVQRGGTRAWPPPYFGDTLPHSAADLLASVPDEWVEDAACLGTAFSARYPEWQGANAELNPEFAGSADIDGADADLIADGCLWEIKTTKRQGGQGAWLHQLLGYALLDYEDQYAIERVGLLLPRHNTQVSWPIRELIAAMSGRDDLELADLREPLPLRLRGSAGGAGGRRRRRRLIAAMCLIREQGSGPLASLAAPESPSP